jgi:hypothetical protein
MRVVTARGDAAAVPATYDGLPGHPVLLERESFRRARELRGDTGARALLAGVSVREVACDDLGSPDDVDTPAQLAQLGGRATWLARPRCTTRAGEARTALVVAQRVDRGPTTGMRQRAIFPVNDSQRFLWRTACAQSQFLNTEAARRLWSCLSRNQDPAS